MIYGYLCPTPRQHCCGTPAKLSAGLEKQGLKKHGSSKEAMACYSQYLQHVLGCEKLSKREFRHPNGGPIEVLTRESHFGCTLRAGKRGDNMAASDRGMPKAHAAMLAA